MVGARPQPGRDLRRRAPRSDAGDRGQPCRPHGKGQRARRGEGARSALRAPPGRRVTMTADLWEAIRELWAAPDDASLSRLLPRDARGLAGFYPELRAFVAEAPRVNAGFVEPGAIVRG